MKTLGLMFITVLSQFILCSIQGNFRQVSIYIPHKSGVRIYIKNDKGGNSNSFKICHSSLLLRHWVQLICQFRDN